MFSAKRRQDTSGAKIRYRDEGDYIRRNFYALYAYPATKAAYRLRLWGGFACLIGPMAILILMMLAGTHGMQWANDLMQAFIGHFGPHAHVERPLCLVFGSMAISIPLLMSSIPIGASYKIKTAGYETYRWRNGLAYTGEEEQFKAYAQQNSIYTEPFKEENCLIVHEPVGIPYNGEKLPPYSNKKGFLFLGLALYAILIISLLFGRDYGSGENKNLPKDAAIIQEKDYSITAFDYWIDPGRLSNGFRDEINQVIRVTYEYEGETYNANLRYSWDDFFDLKDRWEEGKEKEVKEIIGPLEAYPQSPGRDLHRLNYW